MSEPEGLPIYVVYKNPRDYPGKWVCRRQVATRDGQVIADPQPLAVVDSLVEARWLLPIGLAHMPRQPDDDPVIVETWI